MSVPLPAITTGFDTKQAAADFAGLLGASALNDEKLPPAPGHLVGGAIGAVLWQVWGKQAAARAYKPIDFKIDTSGLTPTISPSKAEAELKQVLSEAEQAGRLAAITAAEDEALALAARPAVYAVGLYVGDLVMGTKTGLGDLVTIASLGAMAGSWIRKQV